MKRLLGAALVSLLATAALFSYTPATASPDVCIGQGTAVTGEPIFYPTGPSAPAGTTADFTLSIGGCLAAPGEHGNSVSGVFTDGLLPLGNYCGHSEGHISAAGHEGDWVSAASILVIYGTSGVGVVNAVPDATKGESCVDGADEFLVTGALILI
ncbi:MAG TPA: hypothetical protein VF230_16140 [Acidimicrobiales bacterium]